MKVKNIYQQNIFIIVLKLCFLLSNSDLMGQSLASSQIVQENVDYYNQRNINGFMSGFSDDITIFNYADFSVSMKGKEEVRTFYAALFEKSPELHYTIVKRIEFGNKVIDYEHIKGRNGSKDVTELILVYEIKDDKIAKITVIRK